jgi:hypothetical protein
MGARERYRLTLGNPDIVARHVRQEGYYRDSGTLWAHMKSKNKIPGEDDQDVSIALDGKRPNERPSPYIDSCRCAVLGYAPTVFV